MGNFLFNVLSVLWTILCGIIFIPLLFIGSPHIIISAAKVWVYGVLQLLRACCGITYEVRGLEHLSSSKKMIFMSKHHSAFETFLLTHIIQRPTYVLKKELIWVPLVGLYLFFSKMITIDKISYAVSFKKMIRQVRERINAGRNIIIFPEGGRVQINEDVEYQRGISALYSDPNLQNVEFIPVALNCGLFWPYGFFDKKTAGRTIIQFLPPVQKSLPKNEFMKTIKKVIDEETAKLVEEGYRDFYPPKKGFEEVKQ